MTRTMIDIERDVLALIRSANELGLPPGQLEDMASLAEAGEPGIALENFCTQLHEYALAVPAPMRASIVELGTEMGLAAKYWQRLETRR